MSQVLKNRSFRPARTPSILWCDGLDVHLQTDSNIAAVLSNGLWWFATMFVSGLLVGRVSYGFSIFIVYHERVILSIRKKITVDFTLPHLSGLAHANELSGSWIISAYEPTSANVKDMRDVMYQLEDIKERLKLEIEQTSTIKAFARPINTSTPSDKLLSTF